MSTHNICFRREIRKILCGYPLLSVAMDLGLHCYLLFVYGIRHHLLGLAVICLKSIGRLSLER